MSSLTNQSINIDPEWGCKLTAEAIEHNLTEMHAPLTDAQAIIEADRCYFCYDAPCTTACPTDIDVAEFIRRIKTKNRLGAAEKIFEQNIMGSMCARVCPTEELCEQACVRNTQENKPVNIGLLQRYATDAALENQARFFSRKPSTGKSVAIVGAGPAGLACAHSLAKQGHEITIYEKRSKAGGLNEHGIATYKALNNIAQKEVDYILSIGGIAIKYNQSIGKDITLTQLAKDYDAVFLGMGLGGVHLLGLDNEAAIGVTDAVRYIEALRQADDKTSLPVGDKVVVIGGGMTAVDIAVQSKKLGASEVTIVYRRSQEMMGASEHEQQYAQTNGVRICVNASPAELVTEGNRIKGLRLQKTQVNAEQKLVMLDEYFDLPADVVFKAIGQRLLIDELGQDINLVGKRIEVNEDRQTSNAKVWAGGDCIYGGEDLTVSAVQDGKVAAQSIHQSLSN